MSTKLRLLDDLKTAMRAQDKQKVSALRLITAAIKQIEVDERIDVDDTRLLTILDKMAKQRKESIEQYTLAAREDLVAQENYELSLIQEYLPEPLSAAALEALIQEALSAVSAKSIADMGKVMAQLKPQVQGRCDMTQISQLVKTALGS
ncbi:MAG: GatB/YqeY domain-containing protein [Legionellaceae bacterium]|nr:GatB/YqeY domain-containing protein [Legionellaceae bacterium]